MSKDKVPKWLTITGFVLGVVKWTVVAAAIIVVLGGDECSRNGNR